MEPTFENGLARVGTGHKIHLINPNPTHLTVMCMPHTADREIHPVRATEATCKRCLTLEFGRK